MACRTSSESREVGVCEGAAVEKDLLEDCAACLSGVLPSSGKLQSDLSFFFFFFFFLISWRLITLQYCSGFCHTLT